MSQKFNPETNQLPVEREIRFIVRDHQFRLTVQVPLYIWEALSDEDHGEIRSTLVERATDMLRNAAARGWLGQDARDVCGPALVSVANNMIYHQFKKRQERAGNEAWESPASMGQGLIQVPGVPLL